jgi:membrane protein DedA with SNARE-associated domain
MEHIIQLLYEFKYLFLFPLAVVEGPILAIIAGFFCMEGILNPFIVYPIIVLGDITGDSLVYALGRWGNSCTTGRWHRLLGLSGAKIERARMYFGNNPVKTVSLSKLILGVGVAGIFLAGNARLPYRKFIVVCLGTSAVQYTVYLGIGLLFGRAYKEISLYLNYIATAAIIVSFAFLFVYILKSFEKK